MVNCAPGFIGQGLHMDIYGPMDPISEKGNRYIYRRSLCGMAGGTGGMGGVFVFSWVWYDWRFLML